MVELGWKVEMGFERLIKVGVIFKMLPWRGMSRINWDENGWDL